MKKWRFVYLMAAAMLLAGTAMAHAGDTLPKPDVLGEEEVFIGEKLSTRYDTIIVRDFSTEGAEVVNMDEEEQKKLAEIKPTIVNTLTESIVNGLKDKTKFKNVAGNVKTSGNAVIVEGKFVKFNAGHGAAKFWLGWMAPESTKTNITVEGRLLDAKSGKELARFKDTRSGGEGSALGFMAKVFQIQAKDEGEEIADFVKKLY